ncbi:LytR/AlgR family response regulator transcription factor [Flavihumibacter petaseus]|uniref:Putative two-component response regulator n=1 Tax=Flavihumibacter petaseus NBRC 106054 TaxID=1220578 RepID=A0A0E9N0X6_9BACT|nr:LytTR family DNA-binding domain-containing protein [Flavihumibacter petaseus]GAO43301.1 putative two-component response regulator [Flavihumibacter petaseus NBRC 106054]
MTLRCVVIDDEPLARECVVNYAREVDFLELAGTGSNPIELSKLLGGQSIDLVFLDIQMPLMNGIEYLRMANRKPMIIITTAYPSYALDGFQFDVVDYLLKPITFNRFFKAVNKARELQQLQLHYQSSATAGTALVPDFFFIKCDYKYEKIYLADLLHIEALQNYVALYTTRGKFMTLLNLKQVEEQLDRSRFLRVHKSFLVSLSKVEAIDNGEIILPSGRVPIGRQYREQVMEKILSNKLWKK